MYTRKRQKGGTNRDENLNETNHFSYYSDHDLSNDQIENLWARRLRQTPARASRARSLNRYRPRSRSANRPRSRNRSRSKGRSKSVKIIRNLCRQGSIPYQIICSKKHDTRICRVYKACRITMLEKMVLATLVPQLKLQGIVNPTIIRPILDEIIPKLLKEPKLYQFIMGNEISRFDHPIITPAILKELIHTNPSEQVVIPIVILRENGYISHYLLLVFENGEWYYYGSYGSDFVSIEPAKIKINIDEFFGFVDTLNKETMTPEDKVMVEEYVKRVFLPIEHRQQPKGEDNSGSRTRTTYMKKQKGVNAEAALYTSETKLSVVHVVGLDEHIKQLMGHENIQDIIRKQVSTSSAASASGASVAHDHMTHT